MILADTSVWVDHFRKGNSELKRLLNDNEVVCHPCVIGELACGNLKNRKEIMRLLQALSAVETVEDYKILEFIDGHKLIAKGLGLIDIHLLCSAYYNNALLWSLDKRLQYEADRLNSGYKC